MKEAAGLRVLVSGVVFGQPMGGVRRHNAELLPRAAAILSERGGGLVVLEGSEPPAFPLKEQGIIACLPSSVPAGPPFARALGEGRALRRALSEAQAAGTPFDLVHTGHLPVPRRLGTPYSLTLHDLRDLELSETPLLRRVFAKHVIKSAVRRAALVITVSEDVAYRVRTRFDVARVAVVPNGADHLRVLERRAADEPYVLYVGHIEPRKNLDLALRALAHDPALPSLVFVGAPKGDEDGRLKSLARSLGVGERVTWRGRVTDEELAELYSRASALVLPSRIEGFGIPVLEAQQAGLPVAVAQGSALVEVAGKGAPTFAPDDVPACAWAIREALRTPASALAERAARAKRHTWAESAEKLVAAWTAAVSPRNAR